MSMCAELGEETGVFQSSLDCRIADEEWVVCIIMLILQM